MNGHRDPAEERERRRRPPAAFALVAFTGARREAAPCHESAASSRVAPRRQGRAFGLRFAHP